MNNLHKIGLGLMLLILAACQNKEKVYKDHYPADKQEFITDIQDRFNKIKATEGLVSKDSTATLIREAHLHFYHHYPVYYDWWLQDGSDVKWFDITLPEQISERLQKLQQETKVTNTPESITQALSAYLDACKARREQRLASFIKNTPEVVFTKFRTLRPSFFAYTEGLSDARAECNFFAGGELAYFKMDGIWAKEETLLKDTAGVFRDPDVHFDGKHILFAWKKSQKEDDFHLYEMEMPSRKLKQITSGLGFADIEPIYLPDENILFNSTRNGSAVDCWTVEVSNLYLCDREGRYMRQVGFDQVHTSNPTLLDDGRVVYTRWEYNDRGQVFMQPLCQMNPDGTGQAEYYGGNSFFPTTLTHTRQIPGTRKVMATILGHHTPQHGKLCIIDPEAGRDENEGVMLVAPLRKPEAVKIDAYGQFADQFQHPYPLNEKEFLISYTPLGYHVGHPMEFGIYWMTPSGERELLVSDASISCNQPVLLSERERPFQRVDNVDYTKEEGVYYMQNIYEGNGLKGVQPGTIKKLRIVEPIYRVASIGAAFGFDAGGAGHAFSPVGVGNASWDVKRILGTVDVNPDGSAFFKVPCRTPLYFQALDENNRVVQTMRSWSTLQPGETQSCVGCHEHKNTVPIASHPVSMAMNTGIQKIEPEGIGDRCFSYIKEVQPIWDAHCISCHDGVKSKLSLKGELKVVDQQTKRKFSDSYLNLTHARQMTRDNDSWQGDAHHPEVNWISNLSEPTLLAPYFAGSNTSNLIKRLENGHGGCKLSKEEIETIALWIDLCVPFIGDYREANNWTQEEKEYYTYYEKKRETSRAAEKENIRQYLQSLKAKK
ncbi:hypothetical protein DWW91_05775 [Parabacteroides sp. AF17-3]|uniref:HzsA-related protein n=1 Tax=Parabacteroides sp. AF17-3 TaxID=2293113 RepID=UPI000EFDE029|nr:hypothetical protein [Parabacteroides sp. AF17-3]RKU72408.1 hypothetical protein DWW91_05775 [Parabacteroides sp. AF17-3]